MECYKNITKGKYMLLSGMLTEDLNKYYNDPNRVVAIKTVLYRNRNVVVVIILLQHINV